MSSVVASPAGQARTWSAETRNPAGATTRGRSRTRADRSCGDASGHPVRGLSARHHGGGRRLECQPGRHPAGPALQALGQSQFGSSRLIPHPGSSRLPRTTRLLCSRIASPSFLSWAGAPRPGRPTITRNSVVIHCDRRAAAVQGQSVQVAGVVPVRRRVWAPQEVTVRV